MRLDYPVDLLCRAFEVSRSGFYAWLKRKPCARKLADERLKVAIKAVRQQSRQTYGVWRMQPELHEQGFPADRDRIDRPRRELGLRCRQKRKFKATTNSRHDLPVAANLLEQRFEPTTPNQQWLVDITCVPTEEGSLYLAGVKDVFTCEIVGYALDARMTQELTVRALWHAVRNKRPTAGLIHHSDRGSQYCAHAYRKLLEQFGMQASMSRKGNCHDNVPMESFWGQSEKRSDASSAVSDACPCQGSNSGVHRDLLKSPAASFTP